MIVRAKSGEQCVLIQLSTIDNIHLFFHLFNGLLVRLRRIANLAESISTIQFRHGYCGIVVNTVLQTN